jgi:PAS domain S-box-containing protein
LSMLLHKAPTREMTRNRILIILMAFLLLVVSLLTFHLYNEGIKEVISQFEKRQLSYTKHLSKQIQFYLEARARGLKALSSFASLQNGILKQLRLDIEAYARQIDKVYVQRISLHNQFGTVVYSSDQNTIGLNKIESKLFAWAQKSENKDKISLIPIFLGPQALTFILAIPLYQDATDFKHLKPNRKFVGVLAFTLDMKEFLLDQLSSVDPKSNLDQVWIMDKDGTLLFQRQHPEMVSRNIYQRKDRCYQCHGSLNYAEEILKRRQGTLEHQIRSHPKQIAAFAPMEFENVSWVVVVNTPYDEMTGFIKKSLRGHLFLLGIVVLAFGIGSTLIIRNERIKIKAEEEALRWQEKMAERMQAEEALQLERNKLKGILDSMSDGVYIVNQHNEILYVNPVTEREFGPVKGRKCHQYLNDLPEVCSWCKSQEVFAGKTVQWEWHFFKTGKTYDLIDTPILGPDGTLCKLEIFRDISDRKRCEEVLRQSEKRYRMLVETMSDGLGVQDENGVWIYVNDRLCEMLGYSTEEMVGRPATDFLCETDQIVYQEQVARRRKREPESYELSWLKRDQQKIFTLVSSKAIVDERGQYKGSFAVVTSITELKQAGEALKESEKQLRSLSSQLVTAQETERKRISRELHDELGQALMAMKLRFNFIEKNLLKDQTELRQECEYGIKDIDQVLEDVRRLSRDLNPSILEDFGLSAALRRLIDNFAKGHTIKVTLDMIDVDSLLPQDSHIAVYRIIQEALTNIGKHSQEKSVSIAVNKEGSTVSFSVKDDGIGFDASEATIGNPEEKGLGLEIMKGRARMIGGVLDIRSQEGKGTQITLSIPISQEGTL